MEILIYIASLALLIVSIVAARNYGYKDGYLEGYQQAKDEDFNVVFGIKEKSNT